MQTMLQHSVSDISSGVACHGALRHVPLLNSILESLRCYSLPAGYPFMSWHGVSLCRVFLDGGVIDGSYERGKLFVNV